MCNLYTQTKSVDEIARIFRDLQMPLTFPEGAPNLAPRDIAITDPGVIIRQSSSPAKAGVQSSTNDSFDLTVRRWSWPAPNGRPVYNFRSDGREFPSGRCLIVADGFYEFTTPVDPKQKRKDRWLFTDPGGAMLGIAGLVRTTPGIGEAFTMLTTEPGPDVAPYHKPPDRSDRAARLESLARSFGPRSRLDPPAARGIANGSARDGLRLSGGCSP